jgi:hypothetical protein
MSHNNLFNLSSIYYSDKGGKGSSSAGAASSIGASSTGISSGISSTSAGTL